MSELLCNSHFKLQANLVASSRFLRRINVSVCDLSLHKQYKVLVHLHTNEVIVSIIFIFCEQRKCFSRATSHAALFQNRIPLSQLGARLIERSDRCTIAEQVSQPLISFILNFSHISQKLCFYCLQT